MTLVGTRNHVLDGGPNSPEKWQFWGCSTHRVDPLKSIVAAAVYAAKNNNGSRLAGVTLTFPVKNPPTMRPLVKILWLIVINETNLFCFSAISKRH